MYEIIGSDFRHYCVRTIGSHRTIRCGERFHKIIAIIIIIMVRWCIVFVQYMSRRGGTMKCIPFGCELRPLSKSDSQTHVLHKRHQTQCRGEKRREERKKKTNQYCARPQLMVITLGITRRHSTCKLWYSRRRCNFTF